MKIKKVSICIPAYEQPENLDTCLKSIESQTLKDFEVIITDDSKTNDLIPIVNKYNDRMDILYIKNSTNKGSPENWNESIKLATGKYIKILHHDDSFKKPTSLGQFVTLIEKDKKYKVVFCSSNHVNSDNKHISSHILNKNVMQSILEDPNVLFFGNQLGAPSSMMYEKNINLKFDKRMKWLVDIDFYIRLLKDNIFTYTDDELININIGEEDRVTNSCINNKKINIYETMIMFDKFRLRKIDFKYKKYFLKLFLKFKIFNEKDIQECGYTGNIDIHISKLLNYAKTIYPFYHLLKTKKKTLKLWLSKV